MTDNDCLKFNDYTNEITFNVPEVTDAPLILDDNSTEIPYIVITIGSKDYLFNPKSPTHIESLALSTFLLTFTVQVMASAELQPTWDMMSTGLKRHFDKLN